ncbi:hypothetical protein HYALB_00011153 [Hymenoscyphus albidus]|uniref:Xylanolytic transcriptional activator regulatory domain-containing protein n=1 Tax=Hymenoscyphus albidus TaxID=595503 RepID=A0A9N9LNZ5_9HELO|nr:hypothetical protein HYALB_00011153 [Hymenoscyphus albidus]
MDEAADSKRRRGLGVVTPNACKECRKKRAKACHNYHFSCDGQVPCGRCTTQRGVECVYEIPVRQSKEHMRSEIEQLKTKQRQSERVLSALVQDDQPAQIIERLRRGETLESISQQLEGQSSASTSMSPAGANITSFSRQIDHQVIADALQPAIHTESRITPRFETFGLFGESQGNFADIHNNQAGAVQQDDPMVWDPQTLPSGHHALPTRGLVGTWHREVETVSTPDSATQDARDKGQNTILGEFDSNDWHFGGGTAHLNETWTNVTSDNAFVEHLMALYFCWEYPTFASLSKEHFLEGYRTGSKTYCSPILVNAILALGCRFSNQPQSRSDPANSNTAGDHFFAEATRLLEAEDDRHVLTTIQAMGLMSIREASCGRTSESIFLAGQSIKLAIELGLHKDGDFQGDLSSAEQAESAVRSATFWGAFSLDQAWSLSIGRIPQFSRDIKLAAKPKIVAHVEASNWIPYTDDAGEPLERPCTQPSNVRSVFKTFCELSEIFHTSLYQLYHPGKSITNRALLDCYTGFLKWYAAIPESLRLGQNFTPSVLFVHMYYHYAILLLFRPFMKLKMIDSGVSPKDVCNQAAEAISALVNSYSQLYTLRRTPSFVPYFVLTSSVAHAVTMGLEKTGPAALQQAIKYLKEMSGCHGFAKRGLQILYYLIRHWGIEAEIEGEVEEGGERKDGDKVGVQPSPTGFNLYSPDIGDLQSHGIGRVEEGENPLFWTYPLQGRPLLDVEGLEGAGFRLL